jgi:hypothetical protein
MAVVVFIYQEGLGKITKNLVRKTSLWAEIWTPDLQITEKKTANHSSATLGQMILVGLFTFLRLCCMIKYNLYVLHVLFFRHGKPKTISWIYIIHLNSTHRNYILMQLHNLAWNFERLVFLLLYAILSTENTPQQMLWADDKTRWMWGKWYV